MLDLLTISPVAFIITLVSIVIAIAIHEAAHCYMADRLGDPTPRSLGRVTLNPLAHLDPLGMLAIVITGFGWGKASPYDPFNLRNPQKDITLIALAGPASNIILAILLSIVLRFLPSFSLFSMAFTYIIALNINLALFNLLPIKPLDGSKILSRDNPYQNRNSLFLLLLFLVPIFNGYSLASLVISPISRFLLGLLIPTA
jgi:Zn-dependent protease